jgi:hypothetical protein
LPGLLFGLRLQIGGYGFDLLLNPPVESFLAGLELVFPFCQCSLLPHRLGFELSFSPLGDFQAALNYV